MQTIIKHAQLFEPGHTLHGASVDILVTDEIIEQISATDAMNFQDVSDAQVIDLAGAQLSAGWIDLHVHCFEGGSEIGTAADSMGVDQGVPIIVDAGTAGALSMDAFVAYAKTQKTQIFSLINIAKTGLETLHELQDLANIDEAALKQKVEQYPDFIKGIKVRESGSIVGDNGVEPLIIAERLAAQLNIPVMVHIGNKPPLLADVVEQLRAGDIMTHCYHGKTNVNIIDEATGTVHDFIKAAQARNIVFDIGHGSESFDMTIAKSAIAQGVLPDTVSTDMYWKNMESPVQSLAITMGKVVEAGIHIDDIIAKVTKRPAAALKLADVYGTIAEGRKAVFTVFNIREEPLQVVDSTGAAFMIGQQIQANACFIHDELFTKDK